MTELIERLRLPANDESQGSPLQLLDPQGVLTSTESNERVDPAVVRDLYRDMVLARQFDSEAYNLQRQGELGLWLSCKGQEGAQVGSIRALRPTDHVFPSYREQAAALCRGITPSELLTQWRGTAHGGWDPEEYRFHIYSLVLASQLLHATGYALGVAADRRKNPDLEEIVLCYFGDGAASQGDASEALNWAAVTSAPIIFFCQNNQWAISTPSAAQSRTPLHQRAAGFGLKSTLVDGNDVLAVHAATTAAANRVRDGGPPEFIEAVTYRMAGHSTSDDPTRYRDSDEVQLWERRDPLTRVRQLLEESDWADADFYTALEGEAAALSAATRLACTSLQPAPLESTFRNSYVHETATLSNEREQFTAWKESFA